MAIAFFRIGVLFFSLLASHGFAAMPEGEFYGVTTITDFNGKLLDKFEQKMTIKPDVLSLTSILPGNPTQHFYSKWTTDGEHDHFQNVKGEYIRTGKVVCAGNRCNNHLSNSLAQYICILDYYPTKQELLRRCTGRRETRYGSEPFHLTDVLKKQN